MQSPSRIALTGASAGIGEATARRLLERDWKIVAVARRAERLAQLAAAYPGQVHPVELDVCDQSRVTLLPDALPENFREVDLLVNNAGLALGLARAPDATLDAWTQMLNTNCLAVVAMTRAFLPGMLARGRGHIIHLGSIAGTYPYPGGNVYGATKAFVRQFSLNLKADLLGTPIRVTNIEPGMVETEFSLVRFAGDESKARAVYQGMTPLSAADIAETIVWSATLPAHVNINSIELMPVDQAFQAFAVNRK
jgi:NADP-dependent 3-hydroxy acid dehydrogenase YdfG